MIKNYLKIAWRNLMKNKAYSTINIGGLALGMAVTLMIGLWVYDSCRTIIISRKRIELPRFFNHRHLMAISVQALQYLGH